MKSDPALPLVCDMDGVWISSDVSLELLVQYLKHEPFAGPFHIVWWWMRGKHVLKHHLQQAVGDRIDVASLPVNPAVREAPVYRGASSRVLVSGSHRDIVQRVAAQNPEFDWADGSCDQRNLTGAQKAAFLRERFPEGFSYIGDSTDDVDVWAAATEAYALNASPKAIRAARERNINVEIIEARASGLMPLIESMRLHQWSKNCLVFMMMFLNLEWFQPGWLVTLGITFLAFGLVASATYIFNDIIDIEADRRHVSKRNRPLASGRLRLSTAIVAMLAMLVAGLALTLPVGLPLTAMVAGYVAISLAYSLRLKQIAILDTMTLSLLFCWRVIAGSIVISVALVPWFTAALALFFLSLALAKRGIELKAQIAASGERAAAVVAGRGYRTDDYPIVAALGVACGFGASVVTMIYALMTDVSIISEPVLAFAVCGLLMYWIGYIWMTVNRGDMHHDPIIFALRDRASLAVLALMGALIASGQWI